MDASNFPDLKEIEHFFYANEETFNDFNDAYLKELAIYHKNQIMNHKKQIELIIIKSKEIEKN